MHRTIKIEWHRFGEGRLEIALFKTLIRKITFFAVFLAALVLYGCGEKTQIVGEVLDGKGIPIKGASISVKTANFGAISDEKGKYAVKYIPGKVSLIITKDGYTFAEIDMDIPAKSTITAGQTILYRLDDIFNLVFARPLTLTLPRSDDPKAEERIRTWNKGLYPIHLGASHYIDKPLLSFLKEQGLVKVNEIFLGSQSYKFVYYTDKIKPFIYRGDYHLGEGDFEIKVASRKLKSLNYKNQYEANIMGMKIMFIDFNFLYNVENHFPGIPHIEKTFSGEARAYLDPKTKVWQLGDLSLEDKGIKEFIDLLTKNYEIKFKDLQREIERLAQNIRSAHLAKDINKWLSCYNSAYPNLGRLETQILELWKSYDIKEVSYRIANVQRLSEKQASADLVWNIQVWDHRTHDYKLLRPGYKVILEHGEGGWKIRDSHQER